MVARRPVLAVACAAAILLALRPASVAAAPRPLLVSQTCRSPAAGDTGPLVARMGCDMPVAVAAVPGQSLQDAGSAGPPVAQAAAGIAETDFTSWLANGAVWVIQSVTQLIVGPSSTPALDPAHAAAFVATYQRVVGIAVALSVLLVLIAILEATLTGRPGGMRRIVVGIVLAGIGVEVIPVATALLVRTVDDLSAFVAAEPSQTVALALGTIVQQLQQTSPMEGGAAFALASVGLMVAGALLWLELVVRESLIYVFLGVAPLACAAVQWPRLEAVLRQVLFGGLALILSKLVIAIVLAVGFAVLSLDAGLAGLFGGMFILLVAALTPFATARVLPLAAEELSLTNQSRLRDLVLAGVGTTASLVTAVRVGGGTGGLAQLPLASSAGSGGGSDGTPGSGPRSSGPVQGGGGGGGAAPRSPTSSRERAAESAPATRAPSAPSADPGSGRAIQPNTPAEDTGPAERRDGGEE